MIDFASHRVTPLQEVSFYLYLNQTFFSFLIKSSVVAKILSWLFHSSIMFGAKIEISGTKWVKRTPIYIFSTFGSKIIKFEWKKLEKQTKKFPKPKSCSQLPLIHTSYSIFLHEKSKYSFLKTLTFSSYWDSQLVQISKFKNFLWVC